MGKGIGLGKKVIQELQISSQESVCFLQQKTKRGKSRDLAQSIAPKYLQIADTVLNEAEKKFGTLDRNILFSMTDYIEYTVKRIRNYEIGIKQITIYGE